VLDNFSSGRLENLLRSPHLTLIKGDLLDSETVNKAVKGCELVFHLAANPEVRVGSTKPEVHFKQNVVATFRLLEAMRRAESVEGIVFTSSSTVYGDAKKLPTPEDYAPLKPISIYGAAKLASEGLISSYAYTYGFRAVILFAALQTLWVLAPGLGLYAILSINFGKTLSALKSLVTGPSLNPICMSTNVWSAWP